MPASSLDSPSADMDTPDNPLSRIQREINEVTERENEFRRTHSTTSLRKMSESDLELEHVATNGHSEEDANDANSNPKIMVRAYSTSHLTYAPPVMQSQTNQPKLVTANGMQRRYVPNTTQRGIMQRFIASRGQLNMQNMQPMKINPPMTRTAFVGPPVVAPPVVAKTFDGKPIRKGFVPVEEKIQKELKDLKDREMELKKQRKLKSGSYQLDLSSMDDSDRDEDYESDELDSPEPGKLRPAKSIGELYESLGDMSSPSPPNAPGSDGYGSMKPAKSLAELCELGPDERALAPSSTKLIAKWESLIQQKQESGAA